jgi:RNA polymerase sigma factor (sigma-70 family)
MAAPQPTPLSPEQTYELIERAKHGDHVALDQLLVRVLPRLERWAHGRLPYGARGMLETKDIVQDVVIKSLQHIDTFENRGPGAFLAYLRRGVVNRLEDERRRLTHRPAQDALPDDLADGKLTPLEQLIGEEGMTRYEAALRRLNDAEQAAIIGRFEWGYSYAELAVVLDKPTPNAARSAVVRAVERLTNGLSAPAGTSSC